MRRLAAVALLAFLWPAQAHAWTPHIAAAAKWANARQGSITFAVRTDEHLWGRGIDRQVPSASVFKAMLLTTYLRRSSVRHRDLTDADRALLGPMIRRSDNVSATRVRDIVGNAAVVRLAHRVGMTRFRIAQVWGLSQITARDQTRYFLHIDRFVPKRHRRYAMRLLRTIVPSQRWGFAQVIPDGWTLYFKGGWGSGTGAVDHQVGLLRRGDERVAIAVLTLNSPSHDYGKATLRGVAKRLLRGL
jgi:beta-lactamase family protein